MKISIFLYLIFNIILIQVSNLSSQIVTSSVYILCGLGVLTVGLSHGAIDDVLHNHANKVKGRFFLIKYISIILLYGVFWFLLPNLALIFFLVISGYHFGQSQFISYKMKSEPLSKLLYFSWGMFVLLLLFYCQSEYLLSFGQSFSYIPSSLFWIIENSALLTLVFLISLVLILSIHFYKNQINKEGLLMEFVILLMIFFSYNLLNPFVAFSLFFIFIHSVEVLNHEMAFFKNHLKIYAIFDFVKYLFPFTFVSIVGLGAILFFVNYLEMVNAIPFIILVMISSITAPHSYVMDKFYEKYHK